MTQIETTINEAIEGEYNIKPYQFTISHGNYYEECCSFDGWKYSSRLLLDPKFWQAVEKHYDSSASNAIILARAKHHAGIFMSNLMEGGSIEDVLKQLYENRTRKNKG